MAYRYFVFDDVAQCADLLKRLWKQLFGGQRGFTISGKYIKPFQVVGGVPSILLMNDDDYRDHFEAKLSDEWSRANITVVKVLTPLY